MGISYTAYLILGYKFDGEEMVDYFYDKIDEGIESLDYLFSYSRHNVVVGKVLIRSDTYDDTHHKVSFPINKDYEEVRNKMVKDYGLDPGDPEVYFFNHGC
jgi:hypothetical protein